MVETLGKRGLQGTEVGLVATQKPEVQLPRGRVAGFALEDENPAIFPQEDVAGSDSVHDLVNKLQKVLLVLRASRGERGHS